MSNIEQRRFRESRTFYCSGSRSRTRSIGVRSCTGSQSSKTGIGAPDFRLFGAILVDVAECFPKDGTLVSVRHGNDICNTGWIIRSPGAYECECREIGRRLGFFCLLSYSLSRAWRWLLARPVRRRRQRLRHRLRTFSPVARQRRVRTPLKPPSM